MNHLVGCRVAVCGGNTCPRAGLCAVQEGQHLILEQAQLRAVVGRLALRIAAAFSQAGNDCGFKRLFIGS